jgi:hypothetical protein
MTCLGQDDEGINSTPEPAPGDDLRVVALVRERACVGASEKTG